MSVRVRFAPSPTGYVHIGSLRTALYNYLFAAKHGGTYFLRIEDTDRTRLVDDAITGMLDAMKWAGIEHTEGPFIEDGKIVEHGAYGPYVQSERLEIYRKYADELVKKGHAYHCFCSKERLDKIREEQKMEDGGSKYDGHCRSITAEEAMSRVEAGEDHVIRLKLPSGLDVAFEDLVRGRVVVNTDDLDDQVLMKNDGFPTYHMAVVVDDHLMGTTHVIRGEEWLPSTPKHVYLFEAFGWQAPKFVHLPNILNTEKKKLSKRHGDVSVKDFKEKGYLPEALVNYIALLGWSPEDNREIMSLDELKEAFSVERVSKSGGVFDVQKLRWMNNQYIKATDIDALTAMTQEYLLAAGIDKGYAWAKMLTDLSRDYIDILSEIVPFAQKFMAASVRPDDAEAEEILKVPHMSDLIDVFGAKIEAAEALDEETIKGIFKAIQKEMGIKGKDLFMPVRVAVSGEVHGADLVKTLILLGKENIKSRLDSTKSFLSE